MQSLLFECALRALLIAAATGIALRLLRVRNAAACHAAWASVLVAMLLLPLWTLFGPRPSLRVLPVKPSASATTIDTKLSAPAAGTRIPSPQAARPAASNKSWPVLPLVYLVGLVVFLARLGAGVVRANRLHGGVSAPITVGWLHPRILLPAGASGWPPAQLAAVLAHEREHARRRDPLVQALALVNRAVFWFHPLAWWLERRIASLSEEACDSAVLAAGHDPRAYAQCLVNMARSVAQAGALVNVCGSAMPGGPLGERIRIIVERGPAPRVSRKRLAGLTAACAVSSALFGVATLAQTNSKPAGPVFEVASVKANKLGDSNPTGRGGSIHLDGAQLSMNNVSLWKIIGNAFGIGEDKDYAIAGPGWLKSERYDVAAKIPAGVLKDQAGLRQNLQLMLQALLAERFKMATHRESKVLPAYALVVWKGAPKLKESEPGAGQMRLGKGRLEGEKQMMPHFADILSQFVDRPVVDKTGLTGIYDFKLEWTPEAPVDLTDPERRTADPSQGPSLFTAIQEQLGLRLDPQRVPVEVLVIDRAERVPTEN